jgi:hypothetical protein
MRIFLLNSPVEGDYSRERSGGQRQGARHHRGRGQILRLPDAQEGQSPQEAAHGKSFRMAAEKTCIAIVGKT